MAIEVFMKVARATAAHSNPHFLRRAIHPSPRRSEKCHPERRVVCVAKDLSLNATLEFDCEILRLSLSDSLRMTSFTSVSCVGLRLRPAGNSGKGIVSAQEL